MTYADHQLSRSFRLFSSIAILSYVIFGSLPFENLYLTYAYGHQPIEVLVLLVFAVAMMSFFMRELVVSQSLVISAFPLFAWIFCTLIYAKDPSWGIFIFLYIQYQFLTFLLAVVLLRVSSVSFSQIVLIYVVALCGSILLLVLTNDLYVGRLVGDSDYNPNWIGYFCGLGILLLVNRALATGSFFGFIVMMCLSFVLTSGIIFSQSRGALLSTILCLMLWLVLSVRVRILIAKTFKVLSIFIFTSLSLMVVLYVFGFDTSRLTRLAALWDDNSSLDPTAGRIDIWRAALYTNWNFAFGSGYQSLQLELGRIYNVEFKAVHNQYIDILVNSGFTGLILFFWFFLKLWKSLNETFSRILIVYSALVGLGSESLSYKYFWLSIFFAYAFAWSLRRYSTRTPLGHL